MPNVVCVLGMHRSGTSVAARLLNLLGVQLGRDEQLVPAAADNPKGFWEHKGFVDINDQILERLGGNLVALPPFPNGWEAAPELDDLRERAGRMIAESFDTARDWGWKDPRTCLTLQFWQQLQPGMKYLFCLRDPADVASSLAKRNDMPLERAVFLWLRYTQNALARSAGTQRCVVTYDRLIDDFETEAQKVARLLDRNEGHFARASAVIAPELRHHRSGPLGTDSAALALARRAYSFMSGDAAFDDQAALELLEDALQAVDERAIARPSAQRYGRRSVRMPQGPLASVIVNNYNYGAFVGDAVESALQQTYAPVEVIVVDDGSTDSSRAVIERFGTRIRAVFKENGGQASALNAGFRESHGEVLIFLDADDVLLPRAVERAMQLALEPGVAKVHWPLWEVDAALEQTGRRVPSEELAHGDFREQTWRDGPGSNISAPTSGNAFTRAFLEQVMPIPEATYRLSADAYLFGVAPAFGRIKAIPQPLGLYRVHGQNHYRAAPFDRRLALGLQTIQDQWQVIALQALKNGVPATPEAWRARSHFHQLQAACQEIASATHTSSTLILVDEGRWAVDGEIAGRRSLPFLEADGWYNGLPQDAAQAIAELERMRASFAAEYIAFGWPAFWWLDYYSDFALHLRDRYTKVLESERLVIFDLRKTA